MLRRLLGFAETVLLWLVYEAPRRLAARLTPGLRSRSQIISTVAADSTPFGAQVAVIALFPDNSVSSDIVSLARALTAAGCSVVLISNKTLSTEALAQLEGAYHTLYIRRNVGRDFGAYKDAVVPLLDHPGIERLVLLNDSCHYLEGTIAGFVQQLLGPQDMIGSHENFEPLYHLGSFALSFSGRVVRSPSFREFWINYLPINTRRWAILRGEVGVSRAVIVGGYKPHVIYSPDKLHQALLEAPQREVEDALALLPRGQASRAAMEVAMQANLVFPDKAAELARFAKTRLVESIVYAVTQGSQVHYGAFIYARFLGSPLIKKDLLFRGVFSPDQIYLASARVPLPAEVVAASRARSSAPKGGLYTKRLRDRGLL